MVAIGPMVFAPLSEMVGRRIIYATTLFVALIFIIPCAIAQNMTTLLICRAIDGIAFSAPMTLVGGTLADLWPTEQRGIPMAAFSAAPFIGPAIGPLVGGYLSDAKGWRVSRIPDLLWDHSPNNLSGFTGYNSFLLVLPTFSSLLPYPKHMLQHCSSAAQQYSVKLLGIRDMLQRWKSMKGRFLNACRFLC